MCIRDSPNYGWLVDMGNFLCADDLPVHAVPIAAPYAFHVHVKDFLYKQMCIRDRVAIEPHATLRIESNIQISSVSVNGMEFSIMLI